MDNGKRQYHPCKECQRFMIGADNRAATRCNELPEYGSRTRHACNIPDHPVQDDKRERNR